MPKINDVLDGMDLPENEFQDAEIKAQMPVQSPGILQGFDLKGLLLCPTGPDDDYLNHPLNFVKSEGLSKIIRGVTGLLHKYANVDTLRLAVLDIGFGWLQFTKELKGSNEHVQSTPSA